MTAPMHLNNLAATIAPPVPDVTGTSPLAPSDAAATAVTTTSNPPTTTINTTTAPLSPSAKRRNKFNAPRTTTRETSTLPSPWKSCKIHKPTLDELQSQSFTEYVRHVVLKSACLWRDCSDSSDSGSSDDDGDDDMDRNSSSSSYWTRTAKAATLSDWSDVEELPLCEGMAKISLPNGFWSEEGISRDRTGRGHAWQAGQPLGDYILASPIQQHVRGLAGVYEFIFTEEPPMTIAAFRKKADEYREQLVGCAYEKDGVDTVEQEESSPEDDTDDRAEKLKVRMAELERLFWKRLGPTMPPAWYGADEEGSFFGDDEASGWAINKLDSCLHLLSNVPGVTTPYLYLGMWGSSFAAHTEDINLLSINYLHAGAPKIWYAVAPGRDAKRFEELAASHFRPAEQRCKEFLRHKRNILSPQVLQKAGIPFTTMVQYPGDAMITFPGGYHFGFNSGYNVAEATNFGVPEWIPFGMRANICLCRPDSVRIDMNHFILLLNQYQDYKERQRRKGRRGWQILSCKAWARERFRGSDNVDDSRQSRPQQQRPKRKRNLSEQQKRREFYIEVMKPVATSAKSAVPPKDSRSTRGGNKRNRIVSQRSRDVWHLARSVTRKTLAVDSPVLVLLPAMVESVPKKKVWKRWDASSDEEEEEREEQCFAGTVSELSDGHVRVNLTGLAKSEDIWVSVDSTKLFLDGGQWEEQEDKKLPELHYWKESDSKKVTL
ncbi:hypothetical protein MPSEU_000199300 [Mayamaea pseudoterrestris]|nr:hypothetical protein MPSEU_000199300 [Mayamaea pseudoterrestris]